METINRILAGTRSSSAPCYLYKSDDVGFTWQNILTLNNQLYVRDILYLDNNKVILCTDASAGNIGLVYTSDDNGTNWNQSIVESPVKSFYQLVYLENGILIMVGGSGTANTGKIYRSVDYGKTFSLVTSIPSTTWVRTLVYIGKGIVLAGTINGASNFGYIYRSIDYGITWVKVTGDIANQAYSSAFKDLGNGVILHSYNGFSGQSGSISRSEDWGQTWQNLGLLNGQFYLRSFAYLGKGIIYCGGTNTTANAPRLYRSDNYGKTWLEINTNLTDTISIQIVINTGKTIIVGSGAISTANPQVLTFNDNIFNFKTFVIPSTINHSVQEAVYLGNGIVIFSTRAVSGNGNIYISSDYGNTWNLSTPIIGQLGIQTFCYLKQNNSLIVPNDIKVII